MLSTCLPRGVSESLRVLRSRCRHRHHLVFSWLLVLHLVYGERANRKPLARHGPGHVAYQHFRCLVCAAYWCTKTLLWWSADEALQAFPPPEDGTLYLVGDSTLKGKRGQKHSVAQKTRLSQHRLYVFGFPMVVLMAQWGVYRIPVDFALVRRKGTPSYQSENALFRHMLREFRPPAWCQEVVVVGDAAYAARANKMLIEELGYWYVFAIARTWKFTNGKALKALTTHLPRWWDTQIRIPTISSHRRRTFWIYAKRVRPRYLGDVTVVLSKCGRNDGPKQTKILVTNLPATKTARNCGHIPAAMVD